MLNTWLTYNVRRPEWSSGGVWYFTIYATDGKRIDKVYPATLPYTTKREATEQAEKKQALLTKELLRT